MKLTSIQGPGGQAPIAFPGGVAAATAAVNDPGGDVGRQLDAYHALSSRWAGASHAERAGLTQALTDSPFARTIQTAVNTFTKAAWPGADAAPPAPQQKMLQAFDGLSADHQQIVASLQVGIQAPAPRPASVEDYRARLQADLDAVQPKAPAPRDTVTLSDEAKAWLAGGPSAIPAAPVAASPEMARAISAYAKAAR
ncbi:MAG: hypothetical protein J7521_15940 [Caulobacter sp.]|nr:hypothetical protein [Caulobacter sp.]